jgi:methylmalonyl-CoA mutase N-terminal domain/subunit
MVDVANSDGNLIKPMMAAVRAEATLGEICDALRNVWGGYTEPARF